MSRFNSSVHYTDLNKALAAAELPESSVKAEYVNVAHGYDRPCYAYFVQAFEYSYDEPTVDFYYGVIGLGESITRGQMIEFWSVLADAKIDGAQAAFDAVCLDLPY